MQLSEVKAGIHPLEMGIHVTMQHGDLDKQKMRAI
jgi:hypothetical protein